MIHRAPLGSLERFIGVLIEHFAGAFPLWLAPEQVRVLSLSEKVEAYAREVERSSATAGFRVTGDYRAEKIGSKIRDAQLELIPYMFVIGPKEADGRRRWPSATGSTAIWARCRSRRRSKSSRRKSREKRVRQVVKSPAPLAERGNANEY